MLEEKWETNQRVRRIYDGLYGTLLEEEVDKKGIVKVKVKPDDPQLNWKKANKKKYEKVSSDRSDELTKIMQSPPVYYPENKEIDASFSTFLEKKKDSHYYSNIVKSDRNRILYQEIPGYKYQSKGLANKMPWNDDESNWYNKPENDKKVSGPWFSEKTVKLMPRSYINNGELRIRWGRDFDGTLLEWQEKVKRWELESPNIKRQDGSNHKETVSQRSGKTKDPKIIFKCWETTEYDGYIEEEMYVKEIKFTKNWLKSYRAGYSENVIKMFSVFRIDMYGNLIALPSSVEGGIATNNSLTFFDVDHLFAFCRGGRSDMKNFAAVQSCVNRKIKNDNLIQNLSPRKCSCGIMASQLLSMIDFVEELKSVGRNTKKAFYDNILSWLTSSPVNGSSFADFQDSKSGVNYSLDAQNLFQYFINRQERQFRILLGLGLDPIEVEETVEVATAITKGKKKTLLVCRVFAERDGSDVKTDIDHQNCIQVRGNTFDVKDDLKLELGFKWNGTEIFWYKYYENEREGDCIYDDLRSLAKTSKFDFLEN